MNDPEVMLKPTIEFVGPMALHNMPCAICREDFAVFECNKGFFSPCWKCQANGWKTEQDYPWLRRVLDWLVRVFSKKSKAELPSTTISARSNYDVDGYSDENTRDDETPDTKRSDGA